MRVAVEISGQPRVSTLTTEFAHKLQGADEIDWFVTFWNDNPPPDSATSPQHTLIHDQWRRPTDTEWVQARFRQNLPAQHHLAHYQCVCKPQITVPSTVVAYHSHPLSVYTMWHGWKLSAQQRQQAEHRQQQSYDLVIRARPDLVLDRAIDLHSVDSAVITVADGIADPYKELPKNRQIQQQFTDIMFMGNSVNMNSAATVADHAAELTQDQGLHPDLAMAALFRSLNVVVVRGLWQIAVGMPLEQWGSWISD